MKHNAAVYHDFQIVAYLFAWPFVVWCAVGLLVYRFFDLLFIRQVYTSRTEMLKELEEFFEAKDSPRNWADFESVRPALLEDLDEASSELSKAISNRLNINLGLPRRTLADGSFDPSDLVGNYTPEARVADLEKEIATLWCVSAIALCNDAV